MATKPAGLEVGCSTLAQLSTQLNLAEAQEITLLEKFMLTA